MKIRKLGKGQLQILQIMNEYEDDIISSTGLRFCAFFSSFIGDDVNRILTIDRIIKLRNSALIEEIDKDWTGARYRITELGKRILNEQGRNDEKCKL